MNLPRVAVSERTTRAPRAARISSLLLAALVTLVAAPDPMAAAKGKVRKISGKDLVKMLRAGERVLLLDVRSGGTSDRIPEAVHVPLDRIDAWAATIEPDTKIVAYCT